MLTKLTIRNFKRFEDVEIELGSPVVFVGPNNSGKTSALQALALWDIGLKRWNERRSGRATPEKRPGVTVNRRDLVAIPIPNANLLWRELHVRDVSNAGRRQQTSNVRIEVTVDGVAEDRSWSCGLEFDYANEESFYCRPLRVSEGRTPERMPGFQARREEPRSPSCRRCRVSRQPKSRLEPGAVNVRIGEARTAEVLRNLCHRIREDRPEQWQKLVEQIGGLFGAELQPPRYIAERGEITMSYRERRVTLDLLVRRARPPADPAASRLPLREPQERYCCWTSRTRISRSSASGRSIACCLRIPLERAVARVIAASHSEVLLNEAADKDLVIAFVGRPHRLAEGDRGSQVYEGAPARLASNSTTRRSRPGGCSISKARRTSRCCSALARRLGHESGNAGARISLRPLRRANRPREVQRHFHGLREGDSESCAGWPCSIASTIAPPDLDPVDGPCLAEAGDRELPLHAYDTRIVCRRIGG